MRKYIAWFRSVYTAALKRGKDSVSITEPKAGPANNLHCSKGDCLPSMPLHFIWIRVLSIRLFDFKNIMAFRL